MRDVSLLEFGEGEIVQENLEVQEMAGGDVKTLGNGNEALGGSGNSSLLRVKSRLPRGFWC